MATVKFPRVGELILHLVHTLRAVKKHKKMGQTMAYLANATGYSTATVFDWRQGYSCPPEKTVEILIRIGKEEANLARRQWGESLLRAVRYPYVDRLVNETWGPLELRQIPNNLPRSEHTRFFGRLAEMKRLLELLSPNHATHLISIDGIGGVGKTALALEVAYKCLRVSEGGIDSIPNVPTFEAIIFVSAKQTFLTAYGRLERPQTHRLLRDIYHKIAEALDKQAITRTTPNKQLDIVYSALSKQRTLLIVDNLETMLEQEAIMAFLYDLPKSVKTVITTRERAIFAPIRLSQLPEAEGLQLIAHEADSKGLTLATQNAKALYQSTGGVPAAIIYAVGQVATGYSVEGVLNKLKSHKEDVSHFCFEQSVTPLRGQPAHHLFMAIAMFPKRPLRQAVIDVAGLHTDPIGADEGLAQLQRLSLITQQAGRYQMLPLTREYGLAELAIDMDFESQARERWVKWYLIFVEKYGGRDWAEWYVIYDHLEGEWDNLLAMFEWLKSQDRYGDIKYCWGDGETTMRNFTNIYGYWDDRVYWLSWLYETSERRGDWTTFVGLSPDLAFSLTLLGRPELIRKAKNILERAWKLREHVDTTKRSYIAENFAIISIEREKNYEAAHKWLNLAEEEFNRNEHSEKESIRRTIHLSYYSGILKYKIGLYQEAKLCLQQVIHLAEVINWQRAISYGQNYLADIAIEGGAFAEAEDLLESGLVVATRNKDKRRTAFYQLSYARLEQRRGAFEEARQWGEQALDGFDRLGMQPEVEKMEQLLLELDRLDNHE